MKQNNNYLIESEDYVCLKNTIEDIMKKTGFDNLSIQKYNLLETSLDNALEDLDTYGLFSLKKVIVIENIDILSKDEDSKAIKHLYNYLDNPDPLNLLFICSKKLSTTLKLTKELKKRCNHIVAKIDKKQFASSLFEDYKIDSKALNLLFDYCLDDITKLESEILKLKTYKINEKIITDNDILEICIPKLGDSNELIFSFNRSLAEKNKREALIKYKQLLNYNVDSISIVGLLASQFRIIYQVKYLNDKGLNINEIALKLDVKPYRVTKTLELVRFYSYKELLNMIIELADIDLKIKTVTGIDANSLVELFILNM